MPGRVRPGFPPGPENRFTPPPGGVNHGFAPGRDVNRGIGLSWGCSLRYSGSNRAKGAAGLMSAAVDINRMARIRPN